MSLLKNFFKKKEDKVESAKREDYVKHDEHDADAKERIINDVKEHGCHLGLFDADNYMPGFVYSIGLFKNYGHPEIICFGLNPDVTARIINAIRDRVKNKEIFVINKLYNGFLQGYSIQFVDAKKDFYQNYLGYAGWFYEMSFDFPVLQLVWPDKEHHFPWEEGFNPNWKRKQPLLDRNTDFKFYEERNLGVFTTKQAFDGDPILYVYHNEDGDWQFHTSDHPNLDDMMVVALEQITKLDPSINDIYHLQYGWNAWRSSPEDKWEYAEDEDSEDD